MSERARAPRAETRVAIDASSATAGGGLTYLRQLLPRLAEEPGIRLGPVLLRDTALDQLDLGGGEYDVRSTRSRLGALARGWRRAVSDFGAHVVFAPTEISFTRYRVPLVLAVRYPGFPPAHVREYPAAERPGFVVRKMLSRASARLATTHIAVSRHAADVAIEELGVAPDRVRVVYHGGPDESPPPKQGPATNFLFVSNLYRYKNVGRLVQAFAGADGGTLRIVGRPIEPRLQRELDALMAARPGLGERVRFLGPLHGAQLADAYRGADCFVWPPYAETFGHPLLEARSFGLPIIAARASSNAEIAGDAAVYFDPFDVNELRALLEKAVADGISVGSLPRRYSWDVCSTETARVLIEAAGSR